MDTIKSEIISWPIQGSFRISRSSLTHVDVVVVTISSGRHFGRGECRPYPRYGETPQSVCTQIKSLDTDISTLSRETLMIRLPSGAARNAVDCALWDLEAQITGKPVFELMNLSSPKSRETAFTLSLDTPVKMAKAAMRAQEHRLLKIKIGGHDGLDCALAVLNARPDASLIIDANEALDTAALDRFQSVLKDKPIALIEQPLAAGTELPKETAGGRPIICADESLHTSGDLVRLWNEGYRAVNIKLDKAGGLTEAFKTAKEAKAMGFQIMLGCMVSSSLSMAPAMLLEGFADIIDLDGALLLAKDHLNGVAYEKGRVTPAPDSFWGYPRPNCIRRKP